MGSPLRVSASSARSNAGGPLSGTKVVPALAVGSLALLALAFLLGRSLGSNDHQAIALGTPTANPCRSASEWLETITRQERAGQWQAAADNAEVALTTPNLCAEDRAVLEKKAINDGLEALFTERFDPRDVTAQQAQVDRYRELSVQAAEYGDPFPSAAQVAQRAYGIGQFLLAKEAWETAYRACEITIHDREQLQQYVATLHNLGYWWATQGVGETREEGLRLLQTGHLIDVRYQIGSGESWGALRRLLGASQHEWPEPAPSPVLNPDPCTNPSDRNRRGVE